MNDLDGMQRFHSKTFSTRPRWQPPPWLGLLGIAWIVGVVVARLLLYPFGLWSLAFLVYGGAGIAQCYAFFRGKEQEWKPALQWSLRGAILFVAIIWVYGVVRIWS